VQQVLTIFLFLHIIHNIKINVDKNEIGNEKKKKKEGRGAGDLLYVYEEGGNENFKFL